MQGKRIGLVCVVFFALMTAACVLAQDPLSLGTDMYRLMFENERVRVMQVTFQPGESIKAHSHPDHFVYVIEGGTLRLFKPDGTSTDIEAKHDQVFWIPAESHWAENVSNTVIRLLVTELKDAKPAAATE